MPETMDQVLSGVNRRNLTINRRVNQCAYCKRRSGFVGEFAVGEKHRAVLFYVHLHHGCATAFLQQLQNQIK